MDLQIAGKRALVTGSSSGIGAEIAKMLAKEGVKVIITGRNQERASQVAEAIKQEGGEAIAVSGNLSTIEGARQVVEGVDVAFLCMSTHTFATNQRRKIYENWCN